MESDALRKGNKEIKKDTSEGLEGTVTLTYPQETQGEYTNGHKPSVRN